MTNQPAKLTSADLTWLGRMLEEDLSGLIGYESLLVRPPDEGDQPPLKQAAITGRPVFDFEHSRLFLPLGRSGRVRAVARLSRVLDLKNLAAKGDFLNRLADLTLDRFELTQSLVLDPVTGLWSRLKLMEELGRMIKAAAERLARSGPRMEMSGQEPVRPGGSLVVVRFLGLDRLVQEHGRGFLRAVQRRVADELTRLTGRDGCPTRLNDVVFAWLEPGLGSAQAAIKAQVWAEGLGPIRQPGQGRYLPEVIGGVAAFPDDLPGPWNLDDDQAVDDLAREVEDLAGRGLARASRLGSGILSLAEVKRRTGAVTEILPLDRVVIDLGRSAGVEEGDSFHVVHHSEAAADVYKARLTVISVSLERATAEITALEDERFPVSVGDRLVLAEGEGRLKLKAADEKVILVAGQEVKVLLDQSTGLPGGRSLPVLAEALARAREPFCLLLVRLEGLVSQRSLIGQHEADKLLNRLAELGRRASSRVVLARAGVDSVALFLPGLEAEAGLEAGHKLADLVRTELERAPAVGLAAHPFLDTPPAEVVDRALKALDHASFPEAESVVLFNAVSLNVSADRYYQRGDLTAAAEEYERALAVDPANVNVVNSLGACYGLLGRLEEAAAMFARATELDGDDFMAWYNLGLAHKEAGRTAEAQTALGRAQGLKPDDFDVMFALGQLELGQGRAETALDWLEQAARAEADREVIHRWLGEAYLLAGRREEALSRFKAAVKVRPDDAAALSWLGRLYLDGKRDREVALSLTRQAVDLAPVEPIYRQRLGWALVKNRRAEEALAEFKSALSSGERDLETLWGLGLALAALDRPQEAQEVLAEAHALAPDHQALAADLDRVTAELGRREEEVFKKEEG